MSNLKVEIISPEGVIFSGECHMAVVPAALGDIGFMHGHEVVITLLREGQIAVYDDKQTILKQLAITSGSAEMTESGKLLILVDGQAQS